MTYPDGHGQLPLRLPGLAGLAVVLGLLQTGRGFGVLPQSHHESHTESQASEQGDVREQELAHVGNDVKFFAAGPKPIRVAYTVAASS